MHGAVGTPLVWKKIIEEMDRKKFQPWFYFYPSGLRLDEVAETLNEIIKRIHASFEFNTLYVTAHSMGGLVSRAFILKNIHADKQDYIKQFVAISTPWNGHRLTAKGIKVVPSAIPSWHDMVPDSQFIRSIYEKGFSPDIKYYLLFSFRGDCSLLQNNNDGTVEISSELDYRAQSGAEKTIGFNEDHTSILGSQKLLEIYNDILNGEQVRW